MHNQNPVDFFPDCAAGSSLLYPVPLPDVLPGWSSCCILSTEKEILTVLARGEAGRSIESPPCEKFKIKGYN